MRVFRFLCLLVAGVSLAVAVGCIVASVLNKANAASLTPGVALVVATRVSSDSCSYRCCDSHNEHCHTCYESCWHGTATVDVVSGNTTIIANYMLATITSYSSYQAAYNYNAQHFPKGSLHDCYYRTGAIVEVEWALPDQFGPLIASFVFFGIAAAAVVVWGFVEAAHWHRHRGYHTVY